MPNAPVERVRLAPGLALDCSFPPQAMDEVVATLTLWGRALGTMRFRAGSRTARRVVDLGLVRLDLGFDADMFEGELVFRHVVEVRGRGSWRKVGALRRSVLRFDPSLGEVAGCAAVYPPLVDDPVFGKCQPCTPAVLRFHVDDRPRHLCRVGSVVKELMFSDYPPFVFNTVACVGAFPPGGAGQYTDPDSIWFNTFVGYYQLDCAKHRWSRPFGYEHAAGSGSVARPEDLVRLGKSDWNWFSNWDYGVPADVLLAYSAVPPTVGPVNQRLVTVGARRWHEVEVDNTKAASCYVAGGPGARQLVHNTVLEVTWRRSFGGPRPRPAQPTSFIATVLDASVYMSYWEDDTHFHTVIFGGTIQAGKDRAFLEAQLDATRAVMATDYPGLGFP